MHACGGIVLFFFLDGSGMFMLEGLDKEDIYKYILIVPIYMLHSSSMDFTPITAHSFTISSRYEECGVFSAATAFHMLVIFFPPGTNCYLTDQVQ